jgi:hypothetical protein
MYRDTQGGGLYEVLFATIKVILLSGGLGSLSPVYEAEEEGSSSIVRLEKQSLLEIFFGALQRRGLPQEWKHPSWMLYEQVRLGCAEQCVHLHGRLNGLALICCFEGRNRGGKEAFARGALCL